MNSPSDTIRLVEAARAARAKAYAPYSGFAVGAAVRLLDGSVIAGANLENASYGLSLCAEAVAIAAANAQGRLTDIEAIAVVGGDADPVTPCGRCRQILNEAERVAGRQIAVYCAAAEGRSFLQYSVAELLPFSFGFSNLNHIPFKMS